MNLLEHNRTAWNKEAKDGNKWTIPVEESELKAATKGEINIVLTPHKPIPKSWLGDVKGKRVLCLASGGGQQGPILAAAGAEVTVFDNSDEQLKRDEEVAERYDLDIKTVQGNMQDLSCFENETFDMVIHPVSNCYVDDILPVWRESSRVLKEKGSLLSGFANPLIYMVDWEQADETKKCVLRYSIPYSDTLSLSHEKKEKYSNEKIPFEFGHTLTDQIQGQIEAGLLIAGFYEDRGGEILDEYTEAYIATRAVKY